MTKYKYRFLTEELLKQKIKDKRGQGVGPKFKPWLTIHELSSVGHAVRDFGYKTKRPHHFLSNYEFFLFLILEWRLQVVDIREQFPLLPFEEILQIAYEVDKKFGKKTERDAYKKDKYYIPTSDFRVTKRVLGGKADQIFTVKSVSDLDKNQILKFEIERRYWSTRGIPWQIITDHEIDSKMGLVRTIRQLRDYRDLTDYPKAQKISLQRRIEIIADMAAALLENPQKLVDLSRVMDQRHNILRGTSLTLAQHALAHRWWEIDWYQKFNTNHTLNLHSARTPTLSEIQYGGQTCLV